MRIIRSGLVAVAVLVLAGCGTGHSQSSDRRAAVNSYFTRVNVAEASVRNQSGRINTAFRSFSLRGNRPAELRALRHAEAELVRTRHRVARIRPPAEARMLHADLVRLLTLEASIAGELLWTTRYSPRLARVLHPLQAAGARLSQDLRGSKRWRHQAAAFERYGGSLEAVLAGLKPLRAPPMLRPAQIGEEAILRRSVALCASIAAALRKHDGRAASAGIRTLSGLAVGSTAARTRRGQIAAARAYNRRIADVAALTAKIARERERLARTLR